MSSAPSRTTPTGSRWLTEELPKLGLRVTPSVGNFILIHFPTTRSIRRPRPTPSCRRAATSCAASRPTAFPNALRMTVGTEEANRGVVAALAEFLKS